jgi:hypothetical protein
MFDLACLSNSSSTKESSEEIRLKAFLAEEIREPLPIADCRLPIDIITDSVLGL